MKPIFFCLIVSISIAVLVVAILAQKPKQKEGYVANLVEENWKVGMGIGVAIGAVSILLVVFLVYYFTQPKKYNAANVSMPYKRPLYYNLE